MSLKMEIYLEGDEELIAELKQLGVDVVNLMVRAAQAGAEVIRADANRRAPGPHIELETTQPAANRVQVDIGPDRAHWYYQFFETGAAVHRIAPTKRRVLRIPTGEEEIFARAVEHPGMPAQPYLRPALDERSGQAVNAVGSVIKKAMPG